MRQEDKLKEKTGTRLPYDVPADYFKSFKSRVMESLPEYPEKPKPVALSKWQRIKPYVYLAAMFAGIWCMMNLFHRATAPEITNTSKIAKNSVSNTPEDTAQDSEALDLYDYYYASLMGTDIELEDELTELYPNMDDFRRDLYAQL